MKGTKSKFIIGSLFFLLAVSIIIVAEWVIENFGIISIEQYLFHLMVPLKGSNNSVFHDAIVACVPIILIIVMIISVIGVFSMKYPKRVLVNIMVGSKKIKIKLLSFNWLKKNYLIVSIITLVIVCIYYSNQLGVSAYIYNKSQSTTLYEDYFVDPKNVQLAFPEEKKNVIFIQLESMESTYTSYEYGGAFEVDLIPELRELALNVENTHFSNTELLGGMKSAHNTEWTIAGMVSQTAGLPLQNSAILDGNNYGDKEYFLPNAISLGDLLEAEGYSNYLMVGSDSDFAGRRNYFEQHGNYQIYDYYTALEESVIPEDYYVWWGYEDKVLFEYAKEKILDAAENGPFNFHLLTVDTHFSDGYLDENAPIIYDQQFFNVLSYSSSMIYEFVSWIQEQEFYENTVIVLTSDHLTMDAAFISQIDDNYERTIYNVIINSEVMTVNTTNRIFTSFDMFPTILASIGVQIEGERLGFGTNLYSSKETIPEEIGMEEFNSELAKYSSFYNKHFLLGI